MEMNWFVVVAADEFNATVLEQNFYALENDARQAAKNYTETIGGEASVCWIRGRYCKPREVKSEWRDSK
jgi:hypothetical protein